MKSIFIVSLAFRLAFAVQPGLWSDRPCPHRNGSSYIINGEEAPDGKYPYMLSLNGFVEDDARSHVCGASILTRNWALTAAHCCATIVNRKIHLYSGSNSLSSGGLDNRIESFIIHKEYNPSNYWLNDICLIKVKDPFLLGHRIEQITLPPQNWGVYDEDLVTVSGWGYTDPYDYETPDRLRHGKNFVALSRSKCKNITGVDHENYLCAVGGSKGQGVCNGDSGSPLVKNGVLVGIASWVFLPCGCGKPDFYVRVPKYVDWIVENLGEEASELKFHTWNPTVASFNYTSQIPSSGVV